MSSNTRYNDTVSYRTNDDSASSSSSLTAADPDDQSTCNESIATAVSSRSSNLYGVLENALRTQVEVLNMNQAMSNLQFAHRQQNDNDNGDDDGLDSELSRLGDAERTMREELAAAVMEFGRSSIDDIIDANNVNDEDDEDDYADDEESVAAVVQPNQHHQHTARRRRNEADIINERDLNAALDELCRWTREGDSNSFLLNQSSSSQQRGRMQNTTQATAGTAKKASRSRHGDTKNRTRSKGVVVEGNHPPTVQQPQPQPQPQPHFEDIEQRIPIDELCKWLSESRRHPARGTNADIQVSAETNTSRTTSTSLGTHTSNREIRRISANRCNKASIKKKEEVETPYTFHLNSGGASSLLVLGATENTVRAPKGRSPLLVRKTTL